MREVGAFEAKNTLGALLDLVQAGEEVVITRHGKPVARLAPVVDADVRRARARRAAEAIGRLSQGVRLDDLPLKSLVNEGRP
jgi:prevent-host-death family protein